MFELDQAYLKKLEELAEEIQQSDELNQYLEEEEEELYMQLKEMFEPRIRLIYEEIAAIKPLQIIPLELVLLDPAFEGLYLPKILGFSVLRGEFDKRYKYVRPQNHFKEVLLAICQSANFDILKKRIGQSIQIGFAMSSDIWVTNLINSLENKRIRYYLQGQKLERYRIEKDRGIGYNRYKRQFKNDHYQTAEFPETTSELKILYSPLKNFLIHRVNASLDNSSIVPPLKDFIANKEFKGTKEHMEITGIYAFFFNLEKEDQAHLFKHFNETRKSTSDFETMWLEFVLELHNNPTVDLDADADNNLSAVVDRSIDDGLAIYYNLMETIHNRGYMSEEAQEAVKVFYNQNEGLSTVNECLRKTIYNYFARFIQNLGVGNYSDFFEISKYFPIYMGIFANQKFNQDIKDQSMNYVRKLLKRYTDKRGKDYQDIKKFVSTTFQDLKFLKEKEVVELFKTRRKKKKAE